MNDKIHRVCPFCGHDRMTLEQNKKLGEFWVRCTLCSAEGPWTKSAKSAVTEWNGRTTLDDGYFAVIEGIHESVKINDEQKLFVIPESNGGFSCLGFEVCWDWTEAIARELKDDSLLPTERGTLKAYEQYRAAVQAARDSGNQLKCMLTPQLMGLEGKRVEIIDKHGEKRRFTVGKSKGWLPIHLELYNKRAHGGGGVTGAPFKSITVIKERGR
jgi:hypothetical protein